MNRRLAVKCSDFRGDRTDPGPENSDLSKISPNGFLLPPTDHGEAPEFWNSFSIAHRRVQPGGWTRQVTVEDFPISKDIAGVNMRPTAGGIRQLHWHEAAEWALLLSGKGRITALDYDGKGFVKDAVKDDLWFFPPDQRGNLEGHPAGQFNDCAIVSMSAGLKYWIPSQCSCMVFPT